MGTSGRARTLAEKVWDEHVVRSADGEPDLLYIDLHLIHEVTSPQAFEGLRLAGRSVRRPDLTLATEDHNVPTLDWDKPIADPVSRTQVETLRRNAEEFGVRLHPLGDVEQGIVHVVGPQLGLTQPGMTIVCGDSHTSTHGAFGAIAFGIGTSEVEHVLATQTLTQARPKTMAVTVNGSLPEGVTAKDLVLTLIAHTGTGGGQGYIVEYRGQAIEELSMEARMTMCNMSIEWGAKAGLIAPDQTTFDYLAGSPRGPDRRRLGRRGRALEVAGHRRGRRVRQGDRARRERDGAVRDLGHQPRPGRAAVARRCPTRPTSRTPTTASRPRRPWSTWASSPAPRCARSRSTPSSSAPAPTAASRTSALAAEIVKGRQVDAGHPPARRTRFGARADAGRGRGSRRRLQGGRRRVAWRRLLDVPGHEPRPARRRGSAAPRRPTATSRDGRARAVAPTWSRCPSPPPPRSAAR